VERDNPLHQKKVQDLGRFEDDVNLWKKNHSLHLLDESTGEHPLLDTNGNDPDEEEDDAVGDDFNEYFTIPTTNAKVSYNSSTYLLHRYCSCLPNDGFASTEPMYTFREDEQNGLFCVKIEMPHNSPLQTVESKWLPKKKLAKKCAAFIA
jgi:hypothetical protein